MDCGVQVNWRSLGFLRRERAIPSTDERGKVAAAPKGTLREIGMEYYTGATLQ